MRGFKKQFIGSFGVFFCQISTGRTTQEAGKRSPQQKYLTILLVGANDGRRKGSAVLGSACDKNGYTLGMLEDRNNDTKTARILTLEY